MLEGLFQPLHLIILLITVLIGAGGLFVVLRVLWPILFVPARSQMREDASQKAGA